MSKDLLYDEEVKLEEDIEIVEEYLDISEELIELEKNKDLIRMEMNIIEYPIFSKNKKIKKNQIMKYHFRADGSSFIEVAPKVNSKIPGEFSERVFIALTKIMRNNGYGSTFYTTPGEIIENLGTETNAKNIYKRVDDAINRLTETHYKFANTLYSNEQKGTVNDEVRTTIMNIRTITHSEAQDGEKEYFVDKRTKRIYKISFTEYFYKNIIQKGYLVFDSDDLLRIEDSVSRAIFTMITKWRHNNLYLKKKVFHIARRIPLKWDKRNLSRTVKRIEKSCNDLKVLGYVKDFNLVKSSKLENAELEFFFDEEHNKIKQKNFYNEKSSSDFMITHVEDRIIDEESNSEEIEGILNFFPIRARQLKTLPREISKALKKYDYEYVKYGAEYTVKNCKLSYLKYFKDCLEKFWHEEYMAGKQEQLKKAEKAPEKVIKKIEEPPKAKLEKKERIPNSYEEFLETIGSIDNKTNRNLYDRVYGKKKVKDTEEKADIILIEKKYSDITELILELMTEMGKLGINLTEDLIKLINTLKRYKGNIDGTMIEIEYRADQESLIKIGGE